METKGHTTYIGAVQTWECDSNNHMNVMYYINKFELGGRNFSGHIGLTKELIEQGNYGIVVVEQNIKYKQEVLEDDLLYIKSSLIEHTHKVITILHQMYRTETDTLAAEMLAKMLLIDKSTRKSALLPEQVVARLSNLV